MKKIILLFILGGFWEVHAQILAYQPDYESITSAIDVYCDNAHKWWRDRAFDVNDSDTQKFRRTTIEKRNEILKAFKSMILSINKYGSNKLEYGTHYDSGYYKGWQRNLLRCDAYDRPYVHWGRWMGKLIYFSKYRDARLISLKQWIKITDLSNLDETDRFFLLYLDRRLKDAIHRVNWANLRVCGRDFCR